MEVRKIAMAFVAVVATVPAFANRDLGPVGPRCNPDDQYRFFWGLCREQVQQAAEMGVNMIINSYGSNSYRYSPERRAEGFAHRRELVEMIDRYGIDHVEQVKLTQCEPLVMDYAQLKKDGTKNRAMDFNIPACKAEVREICRTTAEALTNLPGVVGVQTSSEVRGPSRPSWGPDYIAACRRDLGFDPPKEYTGQSAGGAAMRADFPVSCVVEPDYKPLKYYVWWWKKGDGFNDYQDMCTDIFHEVLGDHLFSFYDPVIREPPLWGAGGSKCKVGSQWYYEEPEPYGITYAVSEQQAMARGTPGMRVMTMIQNIMERGIVAPKERKVANEPAWVADRPNATYVTQPPDIIREAIWTLFARRIDGIGLYPWSVLWDNAAEDANPAKKKKARGYQFTNPETINVIREAFIKAAVPLGPLLKAVPERAPEVAMLESYASHLLGMGGSSSGWGYNYGDLAVAANLQPSVIYEEEIVRDGIPPSVKVLLAPNCGAMLRTTFEAIAAFQKKGGILAANDVIAPGLLPDVMMPDYLLSRYDR